MRHSIIDYLKTGAHLSRRRLFFMSGLAIAAVPVTAMALQHHDVTPPRAQANVNTNTSASSQASSEPANVPEAAVPLSASGSATNNNATNITVNGQPVPVPKNGTTNTTIPTQGGNTSVTVDSNSTSGSNTSVHVQSNSTSSTQGGTSSVNITQNSN